MSLYLLCNHMVNTLYPIETMQIITHLENIMNKKKSHEQYF